MNIIHTCLLFTGVSFCLAFAALSRSLFTRVSLRFFFLYLLLQAVNFTFEWLLVHPGSPHKATWLAFLMSSSFLMAPCVWLFAREIHQNTPPTLLPISLKQCSVIAVGFLLTTPLLLASHSGTLLVDPSRPVTYLSDYIHIAMVAAVLLFLTQVPWYLNRCLQLFRARLRIDKFLFSSIDEPALNALRALMWIMATNWLLDLARTLRIMIYSQSHAWDLFFSTSELVVTLVALYVIFKRCWKYNLDDQHLIYMLAPDTPETPFEPQGEKYAKSSLDEITRTRVLEKVLKQFEENKIYRQSNLKLQSLCEATGENPHYISQTINQCLELSFFDLVNHYRIEEAKIALRKNRDRSILDIAHEVGFNSKSTFNKAFKAEAHTTPSAYRQVSKNLSSDK